MTKASLLVVAVLTTALAGCTGTPDTSAEGSLRAPAPDCGLAPASFITRTLGVAVNEPSATVRGTVTSCQYGRADSTVPVLLRLRADATSESFASGRLSARETNTKTTDVPNVGDEAYTTTVTLGRNVTRTLVARKGGIEVLISSPANLDKEKALVLAMFDLLS